MFLPIIPCRFLNEPKQLNFLINENETIGPDGANVHGPDSVISMLAGLWKIIIPMKHHVQSMLITAAAKIKTNMCLDTLCGES